MSCVYVVLQQSQSTAIKKAHLHVLCKMKNTKMHIRQLLSLWLTHWSSVCA